MWWRKCVFFSWVSVRCFLFTISCAKILLACNTIKFTRESLFSFLLSKFRTRQKELYIWLSSTIITNGILTSSCFSFVSFLSHCPIINFDLFEKLRIVYQRNRFLNFSLLTFFIRASLMVFLYLLNSCLAYIILILVSFYIYIPFYINWLFWKCVQVFINFWIKKFFGKTKFPCRMFELI